MSAFVPYSGNHPRDQPATSPVNGGRRVLEVGARTSDKPLARMLLMSSRRDSDHGVGIESAVPARREMSVADTSTAVGGRIVTFAN